MEQSHAKSHALLVSRGAPSASNGRLAVEPGPSERVDRPYPLLVGPTFKRHTDVPLYGPRKHHQVFRRCTDNMNSLEIK